MRRLSATRQRNFILRGNMCRLNLIEIESEWEKVEFSFYVNVYMFRRDIIDVKCLVIEEIYIII